MFRDKSVDQGVPEFSQRVKEFGIAELQDLGENEDLGEFARALGAQFVDSNNMYLKGLCERDDNGCLVAKEWGDTLNPMIEEILRDSELSTQFILGVVEKVNVMLYT